MQKSALRPIPRLSAEARATLSLRDHILSGALKPGARLTETPLAEQLGIARATLRMGLHRLASEGIVVQIPYTGWQVVALSAQDVWELWTLRSSLESLASRLAAERMTAERAARVNDALEELATACRRGRVNDINKADFAFHRTIVDLADHARLSEHYRQVEQQVRLYIASTNLYNEPDDWSVVVEHHRPLAAALIAGDPDRAEAEARLHNETFGQKLLSAMRDAQDV
ncbi:MAG: GntR family transcriptional regulator [Pseudomonadota bacterium]